MVNDDFRSFDSLIRVDCIVMKVSGHNKHKTVSFNIASEASYVYMLSMLST